MPRAKPAATSGANRGTGQPEPLDPRYAKKHHIVSSMDEGEESDSFLCQLVRYQDNTDCVMETAGLDPPFDLVARDCCLDASCEACCNIWSR